MPSKQSYLDLIENELATAREALKSKNDGKARVCARRAAGHAIAWYLTQYPRQGWQRDALHQLMHLKDDLSFAPEVRDAASRLTTKISDQFRYPFSNDPLRDAQIIIDCIFSMMNGQDV